MVRRAGVFRGQQARAKPAEGNRPEGNRPEGNRKDSIFVVRAFTTDPAVWPDALRNSAGAVPKGYAFHPPSGNPDDVATPFGWPCPDERDKDYHEALGLLARDIARHLKSIAAADQRTTAAGPSAEAGRHPTKSVFVGVIHDTIDDGPALRQALSEAGMEVLPPASEEPVDEASLRQAFDAHLGRSDALVLIANAHCGRWPKGRVRSSSAIRSEWRGRTTFPAISGSRSMTSRK